MPSEAETIMCLYLEGVFTLEELSIVIDYDIPPNADQSTIMTLLIEYLY